MDESVSVKRKPEGDGVTVDPVDLLPFSSAASLFAGKAGLAPLAPQDLVVLKFGSTKRTNLNLAPRLPVGNRLQRSEGPGVVAPAWR